MTYTQRSPDNESEPAPGTWRIVCKEGLEWSNEFGWVERGDRFSDEEHNTLALPIGGMWGNGNPFK